MFLRRTIENYHLIIIKYPLYLFHCSCVCGFQHEFLDYIEDNGDINKEVFEKIVKCIADGKCPHVNDKIPDEWVKETSVTGLHIAIGINIDLRKLYNHEFVKTATNLFNLELFAIALNKKKFEKVYYCYRQWIGTNSESNTGFVLYYNKPENKSDFVGINKISAFEAFIQARNENLLKQIMYFIVTRLNIYEPFSIRLFEDMTEAFRHTVKHDLTGIQDILLEN